MQPTFVRVIAKLHCRSGDPQALVGRRIRLYDVDTVANDFLSQATVAADGTAAFLFDLSAGRSLDSPLETKPDLFCVVSADDGRTLYHSDVHPDVDFLGTDPVSGEQHRTIEIDFHET